MLASLRRNPLSGILRNRLALSTVVTTLIILVISVLLAGTVTYFAINVTSTRVQEESLLITKPHVWCPQSSDSTQAAFAIVNSGGRDVVLSKMTVRGQEVTWSNVYFGITEDPVSENLAYYALSGTVSVDIGHSNSVSISAASGPVTLTTGKTMVVYINKPDSISVNDIGLTVTVAVFSAETMYYKETNVETPGSVQSVASTPSPTEQPLSGTVDVTNYHVWFNTIPGKSQAAFIVTNGLSESIDVTAMLVANEGYGPSAPVDVFFYQGTFTHSGALGWLSDLSVGSATPLGGSTTFSELSSNIILQSGQSLIMYVNNPTSITSDELGSNVKIGIETYRGYMDYPEYVEYTTVVPPS